MSKTFLGAVENRRSHYALSEEIPVSNEQIEKIIETAIKHAPSAFNSQSSRVVLLKGEEHKELWKIVMDVLREIVPAENFNATEAKINSFAAAYGSILYFEDQDTVKSLQENFPTCAQHFPLWSEHHAGILQYIIWTALEDASLGANLQHYNPLIDGKVKEKWRLPHSWKLIAQMPFGGISAELDQKEYLPLEQRLRIFG